MLFDLWLTLRVVSNRSLEWWQCLGQWCELIDTWRIVASAQWEIRPRHTALHSGKTPPVTRQSDGSLAHSSPLLSSEIEVTMLLLVVAPQLLRPTQHKSVDKCTVVNDKTIVLEWQQKMKKVLKFSWREPFHSSLNLISFLKYFKTLHWLPASTVLQSLSFQQQSNIHMLLLVRTSVHFWQKSKMDIG